MKSRGLGLAAAGALGTVLAGARDVAALDKQGSAHGGDVQGATGGVKITGAVMGGVSLYNPTYGARPDNSGRALMRYALHLDADLIGRALSVPLDLNLFSDRQLGGAAKLEPTELDVIAGLSTTWPLGSAGAVEAAARFEHDRATDREGVSQSYADVRARYLFALGSAFPGLEPALGGGDVSGWATLGWFVYNPNYFARPDNTGRALFRYALHVEASFWHGHVAVGVDQTFFTDRHQSNVVRPSELDLTPEIILRRVPFELHLAYERDMPLDRGGLTQQFVYLLGIWNLSLFEHGPPMRVERRNQIPSP